MLCLMSNHKQSSLHVDPGRLHRNRSLTPLRASLHSNEASYVAHIVRADQVETGYSDGLWETCCRDVFA